MYSRLLLWSLLGLLGAGTACAHEYPFREPFTRSADFDPEGDLTIENVNGEVTIVGWNKNEIRIEGEKNARTEEELKRIGLTIDVSRDHAAIKGHLPKRSDSWLHGDTIRAAVRLEVHLPATATLRQIQCVNSTITITDLRGAATATSVNGRILARGLAGDAHFSTVNGPIEAEFGRLAAGQALVFKTVNGSVTVHLPKDAGARFSGASVNGSIDCDLPLTLAARRYWGHKLSGTIGDGRASLEAETVNGGIRVKSG